MTYENQEGLFVTDARVVEHNPIVRLESDRWCPRYDRVGLVSHSKFFLLLNCVANTSDVFRSGCYHSSCLSNQGM